MRDRCDQTRIPLHDQGRLPSVHTRLGRAGELLGLFSVLQRQRPERLFPGCVRLQRQVRAPRLPCAADVRPEEKLLSAAGRGPDLYEGLLPRPLSILVVLCGRRLGHVGSGASRPVGGERATCPLARLVRRHHGRFPLAVFYGGGDPVAPLLLLPNLHLVSQPGAPADLLHRPARLRAVHHILSDGCIFVPRGSAVAGGIRVDDGR